MRNYICISIWVVTLLIACKSHGGAAEPVKEVGRVSEDIFFNVNSAELNEQAKHMLSETAGFMKKNPEKNIIIEGYCDESGSESFNYELGLKRAESVRNYLLQQGISQRRMDVISFGEKQPASQVPGEQGQNYARRVSIKIR